MRRKTPAAGQAANESLQSLAQCHSSSCTVSPSRGTRRRVNHVSTSICDIPSLCPYGQYCCRHSNRSLVWCRLEDEARHQTGMWPSFPSCSLLPMYRYSFLDRKSKKQPKQHHSNKSPNWKPTAPTSCKRKSCSTRRLKSWRPKKERKKGED